MKYLAIGFLLLTVGCGVAREFVRGTVSPEFTAHRAEIAETLEDAQAQGAGYWELLGILGGGSALTLLGGKAAVTAKKTKT